MAQTQINGGTQIQSATITAAQIATAAGITDAQLASQYLYANGSRALTGNLGGGGHEAQNFSDPTVSTSLATKNYVDAVAAGVSSKHSARVGTNGSETYTITSGTVTSISGTAIDGVTIAVGDYVLVKNAPAASGVGSSPETDQPGNGLYTATAISGSITLARASSMSGTATAVGAYIFVTSGTIASTGWTVTTPSTGAFTYGTTAVQLTQFSAIAETTVDATLVKTGNQIARAAITGAVTIAAGSNTSVIAAGAVTTAMLNATGTASSSTYLRGDGTWAAISTVPAAGSLTVSQIAASALTNSSTTITSAATDAQLPTSLAVYNYVAASMAAASAGTVTNVSVVSANGLAGTVANGSSTPSITLRTTVTGLLKGNGTAISAATAGTDYMTPSNYVVRETPTGTINGSNKVFTLASTPVSGTEMIFMNGVLQNSGASNDYTISAAVATFINAPQSGDVVVVTYHR